ncbi:MAG: fibrobacter succinogenes major paralogous domain-containing protein [Bacteroidales bacterium]
MKALRLPLIALVICYAILPISGIFAQTPQTMTYQAIIRNIKGSLIANYQVQMQISIIQGSYDGTSVYSEIHQPTTNENGLVTLEIGSYEGFSEINWANGPYFIKIETDPTGGDNYTIVGTSQLLSVPYALYAKTAEFFVGKETQNLTDVLSIDNSANNNRITNLSNPENDQDAATKAYVDKLIARVEFIENFLGIDPNSLTDIDGNIYKTVTVGNQVWMAENLRVTHYNNGDSIATELSNNDWWYSQTPAYTTYPDSSIPGLNSMEEVLEAYGALYNGYAVMDSRGLCPVGWRVPTYDEWTELFENLGGPEIAGGKLKSERTAPDAHPRWDSPNESATNEINFNGLPAGMRKFNGEYDWIGSRTNFWTSTLNSGIYLLTRGFRNNSESAWWGYSNFEYGMSVRCMKK